MGRFRQALSTSAIIGVAYAGITVVAPPAHATVFQVSVTTDENDGDVTGTDLSLREAVGLVNASPGNHLIELQAGETYSLTLNCVPGNEDLNTGGDLDITADNSAVTIRANGLTTATIAVDASCPGERLFHVLDGSSLILENLVLTGGNLAAAAADQSGHDGGAIKTTGDLTLEGSSVIGNRGGAAGNPDTVDTVGGRGGAVFIAGDLTAINSTIADNWSGDGAAASAAGRRSSGGSGGAIYMSTTSSAVTLINATVHSNRAGAGGPASGAAIGGDGGVGGAVYSVGPVTLSGGRLGGTNTATENRAGAGGFGPTTPGVGGDGGGVFVTSSGVVSAAGNAQLTFNHAGDGGSVASGVGGDGGSGGAIAGRGPITLTGVTLADNTAGAGGLSASSGSGGRGGHGGAAVLTSTNGTLNGVSVGRNAAGVGGGGLSSSDGGNGGSGGAVHVDGGSLTVTASLIGFNDAGAGGPSAGGTGGGGGSGGALSGDRRTTVEPVLSIIGSTISDNETGAASTGGAGGIGGGIVQRFGTLSLTRVLLRGNTALGGTGGGNGGGAALDLAVFSTINSTIAGNTAAATGGGVWSNGSSYVRFSSIDDNTAPTGSAIDSSGPGSIGASVLGGSGGACADPLILVSVGHNAELAGTTCGLAHATDQSSVVTTALGALADNGGPTLTMLPTNPGPLFGHLPVVDCAAMSDPVTTVDQRGLARPVGQCEIGAVELATVIVPAPIDTTANGGPTTVDPVGGAGGSGTTPSPGSVTIIIPPLHGTAIVDPVTGVITYTPEVGFTGTDQFVYKVCAANDPSICGTATVTVNVVSPILDGSSTTTSRPVPIGASRFIALPPARIFDTRVRDTAQSGYVAAGGRIDVDVTGAAGVPETGVSAVVMNVTATEAGGAGFVTVWPTGADIPVASSLNLVEAGQTVPNLVTVPVGADGRVSFFTQSGAHLLADVAGYYTTSGASSAGRFVSMSPTRVFDTREAGEHQGRLGENGQLRVQLSGRSGLPSTGVSAVALNVTIADGGGPGFVTVWPGGDDRPLASNLNVSTTGENVPNLVVVPLGADGTVSLFTQSGGHLLADIAGYFTDSTAPISGQGLFVPISPHRVFDTRTGNIIAADGTIDVPTVGVAGLPSSGVGAVSLNVTATESIAPGFVTAYPTGTERPLASLLNLNRVNETRPNATLIAVGTDGKVSYFTQSGTHLLADVTGYFIN